MRYSRGPGKGGSCSGSEERNRGRSGVERRPSTLFITRTTTSVEYDFPLSCQHHTSADDAAHHAAVDHARGGSASVRGAPRRTSRRVVRDVLEREPARAKHAGTWCRDRHERGCSLGNRRRRGRAQDAALRRRRDDRRDLFPRAARGDGDTARRRLDAHPRPGDRKVRARFPPEAPFSDFLTRNNGARRVESSPNVFPDPLRARLPRSHPRTSSPIPSAHVFPDPLRSRLPRSPLTRPYYCNTRTREVSWDSPASVAPATPLEISLLFDDSRARLDADVPRRDAAKREPPPPPPSAMRRGKRKNAQPPPLPPDVPPHAREAYEARVAPYAANPPSRSPRAPLPSATKPWLAFVGAGARRATTPGGVRRGRGRGSETFGGFDADGSHDARSYAFESGDANGFGTCPTALPRGWIVARGAPLGFLERGLEYYHNVETGESSWTRPASDEYRLRTARGYPNASRGYPNVSPPRTAAPPPRTAAPPPPPADARRPSASARGSASSIIERRATAVAHTERRRRTVGGGAKTGGGVPRRARARDEGGVLSSPRDTETRRVVRRFRGGGERRDERTVRARTRVDVRRTRPRARGDQTRRRVQKRERRRRRRECDEIADVKTTLVAVEGDARAYDAASRRESKDKDERGGDKSKDRDERGGDERGDTRGGDKCGDECGGDRVPASFPRSSRA